MDRSWTVQHGCGAKACPFRASDECVEWLTLMMCLVPDEMVYGGFVDRSNKCPVGHEREVSLEDIEACING